MILLKKRKINEMITTHFSWVLKIMALYSP